MLLSATATPSASRPAPGTLPGDAQFLDRPGGEGAQAPADAVAQVVIQFPMNFMAKAAQDVRLGRVLEQHASLEDARQGARVLADGRASLGVVRNARGSFDVAELLLFDNDQMGIDPSRNQDLQLIMGADPARTRIVQSIHLLKDPGARPVLEGLWIRGGNTFIEFDANGDGNVTFNHA